MDFERDEAKSTANLLRGRFDFEFAALVFASPCLVRADRRQDYGETRMIAVGLANGVHLTVVYTDRTSADGRTVRRIISARRSNRRERKAHSQCFGT